MREGPGAQGRYRRALYVGLTVSAAAHLLIFLLLTPAVRLGPPERGAPPAPEEPPPPGLEVVVYRESEEPPAEEEPEEPAEDADPVPEAPPPAEAPEEAPAGEPETDDEELTVAERLRPREGDPRLWEPYEDLLLPRRGGLTARADSAARAILGEWLDSLRLTEEQRRRARDWTFGEGDERYGISPEGLHLGDITIPIPFALLLGEQAGPRARELRRELREQEEIRWQEAIRDAEEVRDERRDAMRERSREEAERRREDTSSTDPG